MDWNLILQVTLPVGALLGWLWNRLERRFDKIDQRFVSLEKDLNDLKVSLGKLETRVE